MLGSRFWVLDPGCSMLLANFAFLARGILHLVHPVYPCSIPNWRLWRLLLFDAEDFYFPEFDQGIVRGSFRNQSLQIFPKKMTGHEIQFFKRLLRRIGRECGYCNGWSTLPSFHLV